jgi:outer membrane lipopolysaccharide assembly protein LptE/RlpB
MNKAKILLVVLITSMLYGCGNTLKNVRDSDTIYSNTFNGNYSYISRCVVNYLQEENFPLYNVAVYPDNKTAEIKARSNVEYFFEIKFKQKSDNVVSVSMKRSDAGWIFIEKAYIALNKCDIKK